MVACAALALAGCREEAPGAPQRAEAYFLWAGVRPPPDLAQAQAVYLLSGEVRAGSPDRLDVLRPQPPRVQGPDIWLVVRVETLDWGPQVWPRLEREIATWDAGSNLVGLQVDFDAATQGLDRYAAFLREIRSRLPARYRLSVTGLMDWSAHGDPQALGALAGTVDEVVIQTYQGRHTIPGYERYMASLARLDMPYRIGVVDDGGWREPAELACDPDYRGTVVFLTGPRQNP
ncbi:MAG: DUF3142 domain-containing protein [Sphingomonadales bacterium]|nr:DUF3142 domain-containing protein [Sphingomonadales bacterium]MBD3774539.1 DUF3142 domain-containing protein [Paracoccaceae bacterium]